jgi:TPR repeat protein
MKKLLGPFCLTLIIFIGSAGVSKGAEPIKGYCLSGTKHSHSPIADKCSASYEKGDYETALREFQPLAEQGNISAQFNLGQMYRRRQGVPQDDKTAVKWYRLAAEQGYDRAQNNLGAMYDNGKGVLQDYKTAVKWYRLAAEQGDANAQSNLGVMYTNGKGVLQDYVRALMWYNIASISGESENASKNRDIVEKRMTTSRIEDAQRLARECVRKKYKGC